jgi:hypothetical protein
MNATEIQKFIDQNIRYKTGWEYNVKTKGETIYLQITFLAPDNFTNIWEKQYCRKWLLSEHMVKTEIVETCWKATQMAELHEMKETFKYKDEAIFNTHLDADLLVDLIKNNGEKSFDYRKRAPYEIEKD